MDLVEGSIPCSSIKLVGAANHKNDGTKGKNF
jgi:hypothetical protein